ncbi:hypothetical protein [Aliihoeflea sp. 2WW]|uniref:hypothetical protein n=1 Tax=Aliihoeflea sp. 2WW TaxID=1381123 RepID=UPI0004673F85|nr:hypothetical protein [Aliihoeflea sp. 2WW]
MDIASLKRDSSKVEAGDWVSDIPGMGDVRLRVRGLSSPTVVALRSRKERKVTREDRERDGSLKPEAAMRIFGEVLHEAVLFDWDGFTNGKQPLPFDANLAKEWLTNPDYVAFADAVVWAAQIVDKGRAGETDDMGNGSKRSSRAASPATT